MNEICIYIIGYFISLVVGSFLTYCLANFTGKAIGEFTEGEYYRWTAGIVGTTERFLYTSAILFNKFEFIGVWFLLKIASQWKRWGEKDREDDTESKKVYRERANFNSYLTNTGLSLAYGILGGKIIFWLKNDDVLTPIIFSSGLVLLNIVFIVIAYIKFIESQKRKKEVPPNKNKNSKKT
ncbi:MAG: hypothetical protein UZ14_CFX002002550 [Chloroflexi bacterium OLB14]|nr:MAG: hypothetical protein UZ14_CFX002002550 [Chloroflexi bacterium OLB14]